MASTALVSMHTVAPSPSAPMTTVHVQHKRTRSRPRPRFWIVDDIEACMAPFNPPPASSAYLQNILAQRSIPVDDEPSSKSGKTDSYTTSTMSSPRSPPRRGKLLADTGYYPGFVDIESKSSTANTWPWAYYDDGEDKYNALHQAERRRGIWRRLALVFSLILGAAYAAYQLSYVAYYYTDAALYYPQPTWNSQPSVPVNLQGDKPTDIDSWLKKEAHSALRAVLANIGPAAGAADGIVIASPSTGDSDEPDYYYTWTRDAGLTISALLPYFIPEEYLTPWEAQTSAASTIRNNTHPLFEGVVRSYVGAQASIQTTANPSGHLWNGGLSEPKFTVTGRPFTEPWGRPQRDGPALRALALIPYAHWLLDRGFESDAAYVAGHLYNPTKMRSHGSVIKNDLEEIANAWADKSFDLWEEVHADHLWGDAVSRRALQAGAFLANRMGDPKAAMFYASQAEEITDRIAMYKGADGIWNASIPTPDGRDNLDAATLLTVIHTGSRNVADSANHALELSATDGPTLTTLHAYVRAFTDLYSINSGSWTDGWLVGRYNSDIYDGLGFTGGNPWYITTFSVAHVLYTAQLGFARAGSIDFSAAPAFWADLGFSAATNDYDYSSNDYSAALERLGEVADAFVRAAARTVATTHMSEQIGRNDGIPRGARDLTWSYASLLEMKRARDRAKAAVAAILLRF